MTGNALVSPDRAPATGPLPDAAVSAIAELAARHRQANGMLIRLVNAAGSQIENRLELLPDSIKDRIEAAAAGALQTAYRMAGRTHGAARGQTGAASAPNRSDRAHLALATLSGAVGGFAGLGSALAELPVTTTLILRAIQSIATGHGFDLHDAAVRAECLAVFSSGSPLDTPLENDDGVNTSFLTARLALSGSAIQRVIAAVAPRFAAVLGQKLALQAVPVLGALTGAGVNYAFVSYYQDMAHVRFGLLRIGAAYGADAVAAAFRQAMARPRVSST